MNRHLAARLLTAAAFVAIGVLHFADPRPFVAIMPPWLPWHLELVYVSGLCEIAGGLGLLAPWEPLRRAAGWGLVALLVAVFPANVHMAVNLDQITGIPPVSPWAAWGRLPFQVIFIWAVWSVALRRRVPLTGKTVLVTGASSGLGRGLALELARRGNRVIGTARRADRLASLADEIKAAGGESLMLVADSTDRVQVAEALARARAHFGSIDVAILNAGGGTVVSMAEAPVAEVIGQMRTNYDTLVNWLVPLIADMRTRGGVIAHTSSPAGMFGLPGSGPYSAAKAATRVLMDSCRIDLKDTPIELVTLYPGFVYTEGMDAEEVPVKALIIDVDRAVRHMIAAIEHRTAHAFFPKRIAIPIFVARLIPEPVRRRILGVGR